MRAWQRWQEAQGTLQKKREAEAKLLWANKPDKLQQAKEEITEVTNSTAAELTQLTDVFTLTQIMSQRGGSEVSSRHFKFQIQQASGLKLWWETTQQWKNCSPPTCSCGPLF